MAWPMSQDYNEAIQSPATNFADADLRQGKAAVNALGLPMPCSGNFADVYQVLCPATGNRWAVKCFTREVPGLHKRYSAIGEHLAQAQLPFTVEFVYLEQGIRIRGQWYQVLKMRWVEGLLLNQFIQGALDRPASLEILAQVVVRMGRRLHEAHVAHGDLQHGNIILVPDNSTNSLAVKLIDYDGMWVPTLAGDKSGEVGHPSYQHPQRLREGTYGSEIDRFPLLLIYCAIRSLLVGGRALWDRYDNGDNLLFREQDLRRPGESPLFQELWQTPDAVVHDLAGHLALASVGLIERVLLLDQILIDESVLPLSAAQEAHVTRLLGPGAKGIRTTPKPKAVPVPVLAAPPPVKEPSAFESLTEKAPRKPVQKAPSSSQVPVWVGAAAVVGILGLVAGVAFVVIWSRSGQPTAGPVVAKPISEPKAPEPVGEVRRFEGHTDTIHRLSVSADGRQLLTASWDKTLRLWDVPSGHELLRCKGHDNQVHGVAFLPDGRRAISCSQDTSVRLWDLTNGRQIRAYSGHTQPVFQVAVSGDGRFILSGGAESTAFLWAVETGKEVHRLEGQTGGIANVAFSPSGELAATGMIQGPIHLWDVQTGKDLRRLEGHPGAAMAVAFSPDGQWLLSGGRDKMVRLWRVTDGLEVRRFEGHTNYVHAVAFSPDGRWAITAGADATVRLWDVASGKELERFLGHTQELWDVAFSPDGRYAFSAGADKVVRMWRLPSTVPTAPERASARPPEPNPVPPPEPASKLRPMARWTFEKDSRDSVGTLHGALHARAALVKGRLQLDSWASYMETPPLTRDVREKTLEVWTTVANYAQRARILMMIFEPRTGIWDGILFAELQSSLKWYPGSEFNHRSRGLDGPNEDSQPDQLIHLALVYAGDGSICLYRNGQVYGAPFAPRGDNSELQTYHKGSAIIRIGHESRSLGGEVEEASLYDRALTAEEVGTLFRAGPQREEKK
jgi:WD40 repeat protein/serine/threonine protein kinase